MTGACLLSGWRSSWRYADEPWAECRGWAVAPGLALNAPSIDRRAARRASSRAAATYAAAAALAREVEARMLERLQYVKLEPARILDAGCGTGYGAVRLAERYPGGRVIALDFALPMLQIAKSCEPWLRRVLKRTRVDCLCADFDALPLPPAGVDLAWSNLALHCAGDPQRALKELHRVLKVGGLLMFSCYGPDTLKELKGAFSTHAGAARVHGFIDMHDLGDMLSLCGYSAPVMDMELITLTYAGVDALLEDLRATGQQNALAQRGRGLTGKGVFDDMRTAYEKLRRDGRLPSSFEIIYGHAWKPQARFADDGRAIVKLEFARGKKS